MQSTVVELSRYTADDKPTNAEWTNRLATPVVLENESYVMVKQAFIDTRLIDQTSILIEQDVQWVLQFMYWVNNVGVNSYDVTNTSAHLQPDGVPYVLLDIPPGNDPTKNNTFSRPIIDDFTINIPKGTYERSYLADFITKQLQTINQPQRRPYSYNTFSNDRVMALYDPSNNFTGFTPASTGTKYQVITPFLRPVFYGTTTAAPEYQTSMIWTDNVGAFRQALFYRLTDSNAYTSSSKKSFVLINNDTPVRRNLTVETNLGPTTFDCLESGYIGASQMAFVYNDEGGNSKFSFQYLHTPLLNANNESIGIYTTTTSSSSGIYLPDYETTFLNAYSGIMFVNTYTNLSTDPYNDPFLKQLGFEYNDIVCPNIKNYFAYDNAPLVYSVYRPLNLYNDFLPYTTRNILTIGDIVTDNTQNVTGSSGPSYKISSNMSALSYILPNTDRYLFLQSNVTEELVALNIPTSSNTSAGHYLVELQCSYVTDYINQEKNYQVKAIIGNYFLSGDSFCMSMGPDSFMHQHQGVPLAISSIKVRLLNPVTKEPATNLGANSTIYLQITKEKPQLQAPPKKADEEEQKDKK